jgi:hypothetical protein
MPLSIDDLIQAYLETDYRVFTDPPITLRIGVKNSRLDDLLLQESSSSAAFITAWNPFSQLLSGEANAGLQRSLFSDLHALGVIVIEGVGIHPAGVWPGEPSYLILGIARYTAIELGRRYQQNALVWHEAGKASELVLLR